MPVLHVSRKRFFELLGKSMTIQELEDLAFDFGIEIEEELQEESKKEMLKIELPANRYDLLSVEGVTAALGEYIGTQSFREFKTTPPVEKLVIQKAVSEVRPFMVSAVLRNITFTPETYESFIDLQDKLHHNLGRKRALVSMGTHDLDKIKGPFRFTAEKPEDISFVPLNQTEKMNGPRIMEFYKDSYLKEYLPLIKDEKVWPMLYDSNGIVLSMPPIINGDISKITLETKNVFIDVTAKDLTKAHMFLNILAAHFSRYCQTPNVIEQVTCEYEDQTVHANEITPIMETRVVPCDLDYLRTLTGLKEVTAKESVDALKRMGLPATATSEKEIQVTVPPLRQDILHPCDIGEDLAVGIGFNKVPVIIPKTITTGKQLYINKASDLLRELLAEAGYRESYNFSLCSKDDLTVSLRRPENKEMITVANPKTFEFQTARTTLIPGILKHLAANKSFKLPIHMFEVGDVVLKDATRVTGARNERRMVALRTDDKSDLEFIHGLLDYIMLKHGLVFQKENGYTIKESSGSL